MHILAVDLGAMTKWGEGEDVMEEVREGGRGAGGTTEGQAVHPVSH